MNKKVYPWVVVALLWGVALLNYMDRQMLSTMQEAMKADIVELCRAEAFGALMAVFLWVYGLVSPFAGIIGDRVSRKWVVVGSLLVWSGVTFVMGYATSFEQLYWLRAIMGVSEALYIPSGLSLIADWHTGKSRSLAVGIHMTGLYTGQAIGGFGAIVASSFSWQSTFHAFGGIGIAYALLLVVCLKDNPEQQTKAHTVTRADGKGLRNAFRGMGVVLSTWAFWVLLFYFAAPSLPGWAVRNWLPTLFSQSLSIPMESAGPLSTITIAASSFAGVILGGIVSDRWSQHNVRGRVYTSAIGLALTIPALVLIGLGHSVVAVVGAGLCFGVGYGMFDANNMPILCQIVSSKYRATAYGIMNMTGVFAGAAVTQVLGKWSDSGNLGLGFALLGCIVTLALVTQLCLLRPEHDTLD